MENQNESLDLTGLDNYYQEEFQKIHDSKETYKGKWNWAAFFFTGIWCLIKGCWVDAILVFLTWSIIQYKIEVRHGVYIGIGFSQLFWSLLMGWRGTWLYYNVKINKKQFAGL